MNEASERDTEIAAVRIEMQSVVTRGTGGAPEVSPSSLVVEINLSSPEPSMRLRLEIGWPNDFFAVSEQVVVSGRYYLRADLQPWVEIPREAFGPDLRGIGSRPPGVARPPWLVILDDAVSVGGAHRQLADEVIGGTAVQHYRVEGGGETAARVLGAVNMALTAGGIACPLDDPQEYAVAHPIARVSVELWVGVVDGFPYRVAILQDEEGERTETLLESEPLREPIPITTSL